MSTEQPWLFPYRNPLRGQLGKAFLKRIPREPGVYFMLGENGRILYVGKAKSLRDRLASYSRARPDEVSRKVIRMLNAVREVRIERCASETEALLRENFLLREIKPPFNRVNTRPEGYYLIGIQLRMGHEACGMWKDAESSTHASCLVPQSTPQAIMPHASFVVGLRLTTQLEPQENETLHGAFKGRGSTRRGFAALLRLLWVAHSELPERFEFPLTLCKGEPALAYSLALRNETIQGPLGQSVSWPDLLERFLLGSSRALLPALSERILLLNKIPAFFHKWIEEDLKALDEFFEVGPRRNRRLKRHYGIEGQLIAQEKIDDLLVSYSQRKKEKKKPKA